MIEQEAARGIRHAPLTRDGVGPEARDDGARHFAPYGSTNALCDETVPRSVHVDERTGEYGNDRFTVKRDRTTCPECRFRMGLGPQEARADEREALAFRLFVIESGQDEAFLARVWENHGDGHPVKAGYMRQADALIAAGYRKHPEPEITDEAALQEDREALATLLDEVHDDCVTEGGCEFVGWQRGWRPFDQSEPSRHVDVIIASPVWQNRHRVPVGEGEQR